MELHEYLRHKYRQDTVKTYTREISRYLTYNTQANEANYADIMEYTGYLRKKGLTARHIQSALQSLKQYYHYLLYTGQRQDHPCRYIVLKDARPAPIQIQDLFKPEELERMLHRQERYDILTIRNRVTMSLLIYQAATTGEMVRLTVKDINLDKGEIHLPGTAMINSRTLALKNTQIMIFWQYLHEIRPQLLARSCHRDTDRLLITWQGNTEKGDGISYLTDTYKHMFPGRRLNPLTIRQSVIVNLLKQGHDIRKVQYYAGHKYPGTTEKYRQTGLEELKAAIDKYHPLK